MTALRSLSPYERRALHDIRIWKEPPADRGLLARVGAAARKPIEVAGEVARKIPGVQFVVEKSVGGLVSLLNDAAQWSVRPGAIYQEYREAGYEVWGPDGILMLDLRQVDKVVGFLAAKYKGLAAAEGVLTGAGGAVGIPADIVALVAMNLRAVGEYGTYCGFDVSLQQERLFAMQVLALASGPGDASKAVVMAELAKIGGQLARKKSWKQLEQHVFVRAVQQVAKALGRRLSKAKLAQMVPAAGAAVGGGFNAYYTGKVCTAAHHLYRERFLAEKYGAEVIGADVIGADVIDVEDAEDVKE